MSEPAPPRENALTRKIGPLPTWGWVVIVAGLLLGWVWLKAGKSQGTATSSGNAPAGTVPQFVNQTFTSVQPPAAPDQDQDQDKAPPEGKEDREGKPNPKRPPRRAHPTHGEQRKGGGGTGPPTRKPLGEKEAA